MRPELQEIITKRKKSYHHFTFELCEQWMTKFVLDLFCDGFLIRRGPFGSGMKKNWKVAALKYLCPITYMPWFAHDQNKSSWPKVLQENLPPKAPDTQKKILSQNLWPKSDGPQCISAESYEHMHNPKKTFGI